MTDSEMITETWEPLPGWPHEVSDHGGRIRSPRGKILAQKDSNRPVDGPPFYQLVTLVAGGKRQTVTVHSCVLRAHRPHRGPDGEIIGDGRPPGMESCHLDDVPDHNDLDNLIWGDKPTNEGHKPEAVRLAAARTARAAQRPVHAPSRQQGRKWWRRVAAAVAATVRDSWPHTHNGRSGPLVTNGGQSVTEWKAGRVAERRRRGFPRRRPVTARNRTEDGGS